MNTFPKGMDGDYQKIEKRNIVSSLLFGNRFRSDQTLYEYLVEFLLVFASAKDADLQSGKMQFHNLVDGEKLSYWAEPRMGLRRFIFYDKSRKNGAIKEDEKAYQEMIGLLKAKMEGMTEEEKVENIESIQDLFHGYAVVIKKRFWGAQALLPICPEFTLCGCDPSERKRKKELSRADAKPEFVDSKFNFTKRNVLARGGEIYYLHLLQGMQNEEEKKERLEYLLNDLIGVQCEKISKMASFVQETWENGMNYKEKLVQAYHLSFIPEEAYVECEKDSIDELINYLSCKMHPINRVEILAKGVMLQIMRMMSCRVSNYLGVKRRNWIVDMRESTTDTVKKIAAEAYSDVESDFMTALNRIASGIYTSDEEILEAVYKAKGDTVDIFRAKGKEMKLIIPSNGSFERFSLPEDIIRFLVLALISPGKKMTLNMFLEKLYDHYGMVIGPNEYRKSLGNDSLMDTSLTSSFAENELAFQNFLKETGFLRELSDATAIVTNPYTNIFEGNEE